MTRGRSSGFRTHGDLIRSTMLLTDESGAANQMAAYTAFGELVRPNGTVGYDPNVALPTRYQYTGGWGYESGVITFYGANPNLPPITLQHVGARWYQPDTGRFVQRDPIGIDGGLNCYAYCDGNPITGTDCMGLAGSEEKLLLDGIIDWLRKQFPANTRLPNGQFGPAPFGRRALGFLGKWVFRIIVVKDAAEAGWWFGSVWDSWCVAISPEGKSGWESIFEWIFEWAWSIPLPSNRTPPVPRIPPSDVPT